jgi:hypothetical protein
MPCSRHPGSVRKQKIRMYAHVYIEMWRKIYFVFVFFGFWTIKLLKAVNANDSVKTICRRLFKTFSGQCLTNTQIVTPYLSKIQTTFFPWWRGLVVSSPPGTVSYEIESHQGIGDIFAFFLQNITNTEPNPTWLNSFDLLMPRSMGC